MYILYGGPFTRTAMTEMVMAEGELAYELREIDIFKNEHRSPDFLAINPAGWVPALVTPDGQTIHEMAAINLYLSEQHNLTHLVPAPVDADRGRFLSGYLYVADELEPALKRYYFPHRYVVRKDDVPALRKMALDAVLERLSVIDRQLMKQGPYYLGDRYSLVDLTVSYWVCSIPDPEALQVLTGVHRCVDLVKTRPVLAPKFDKLRKAVELYARLQSEGAG